RFDVQVIGLARLETQAPRPIGPSLELGLLAEPLRDLVRLGHDAPYVFDRRLDQDLFHDLGGGWPRPKPYRNRRLHFRGNMRNRSLRITSSGGTCTMEHKVVSHGEWVAARQQHLADEKEFTKARDRLSLQRRELPWEVVDKEQTF